MKQFKSLNRAFRRGHLKSEFNLALGRNVLYRKVKKKNTRLDGSQMSKSENGWSFYA